MKSSFNLTFTSDDDKLSVEYDLKYIEFSDGTIQTQINDNIKIVKDRPGVVQIKATIIDSIGVMTLHQIADLVRHYFGRKPQISLLLSYLPYARYDRRMTTYDSHSLKVFGDMLNGIGFNEVIVDDMHSYVPEGIINNLYERYSQTESFEITMARNNIDPRAYDYFIAPDNGAIKKSQKITKEWNVPLMVAAKKRDEASGYTVFDYLVTNGLETKDKTCIILDDICDGGATFINLAENLKAKYGFKKVDLFITHGLFSKGKSLPNVDNIFSFSDYEQLIKG